MRFYRLHRTQIEFAQHLRHVLDFSLSLLRPRALAIDNALLRGYVIIPTRNTKAQRLLVLVIAIVVHLQVALLTYSLSLFRLHIHRAAFVRGCWFAIIPIASFK